MISAPYLSIAAFAAFAAFSSAAAFGFFATADFENFVERSKLLLFFKPSSNAFAARLISSVLPVFSMVWRCTVALSPERLTPLAFMLAMIFAFAAFFAAFFAFFAAASSAVTAVFFRVLPEIKQLI